MRSPKISIALVFLIALAISYPSNAQNSPQDFQNAHNAPRAQVGVGNMSWNSTLVASAQSYANLSILDCAVVNSTTNYSGNWANGTESFTGLDAVTLWVSGKDDYNHDNNSCKTGSVYCFTYINVVWSNSTSLGCARAQCLNNGWLVICFYDPPSDFPNQSPY